MESLVGLTRNRLYFFLFLAFPLVFFSYWWWGFQTPWSGLQAPFINSIFHTSDTRNGTQYTTSSTHNMTSDTHTGTHTTTSATHTGTPTTTSGTHTGTPTTTSGTHTGTPTTTSGTHNTTSIVREKTILLWYWPFGDSSNLDGDVCWDHYHIPNCRLSDQRSLFSTADVVVFHNRELVQGSQRLPLNLPRPPGQRWAWFSLESPENNWNMKPLANMFNLTMSYRRDADISTPYGKLLPKQPENGGDRAKDAVPQKKTNLVCWVVSNYSPRHRRTQVYKELKEVIPIEVYGRYFGRALSSKDLLPTISNCYFYLAFENTISKDYITEKLWLNGYQSGAVPVVLGASLDDYKAVAPPHSFIHVDEFASVKDLGKRLKELVEDKESYAGYLAWRNNWKVKTQYWVEMFCSICSQYDRLPQEKIYTDLDKWVRD